jgi:hypothetical protein
MHAFAPADALGFLVGLKLGQVALDSLVPAIPI